MKIGTLAPIALFVYNRLNHTKKTISFLKQNILAPHSELFIFSDCYKDTEDKDTVNSVREYIKTIQGFKKIEIVETSKNLGPAFHAKLRLQELFNHYERVIMIEDDAITSKFFLDYINEGLTYYESNQKVFSVGGTPLCDNTSLKIDKNKYSSDVFFIHDFRTLAWATWRDRWNNIKWALNAETINSFVKNKKLSKRFNMYSNSKLQYISEELGFDKYQAWDHLLTFSSYYNNIYSVYPIVPFVFDIGNDGTGYHNIQKANIPTNPPEGKKEIIFEDNVCLNRYIMRVYRKAINKNALSKLKKMIKTVLFLRNVVASQ